LIYPKAETEFDTQNHVTFVSPYERYKKVKPFIQSQEVASTSTENVAAGNGVEEDSDDKRIQRVSPRKTLCSSKPD
jgi:hypothetical protein